MGTLLCVFRGFGVKDYDQWRNTVTDCRVTRVSVLRTSRRQTSPAIAAYILYCVCQHGMHISNKIN